MTTTSIQQEASVLLGTLQQSLLSAYFRGLNDGLRLARAELAPQHKAEDLGKQADEALYAYNTRRLGD